MCGCRKKIQQQPEEPVQPSIQDQAQTQLDAQRKEEIKKEIGTVINKYYNDPNKTKGS